MPSMPITICRRGRFVRSGALALAAMLTAGCPTQPQQSIFDQPPSDTSQALSGGDFVVELVPGQPGVFEVTVPAGRDLDIRAVTGTGVSLGVELLSGPGGEQLAADPGKSAEDGNLSIGALNQSGRAGVRFRGRSTSGGTWRFALLARPQADIDAIQRRYEQVSITEQLLLLAYLTSGEYRGGPPAGLLALSFPELSTWLQPVPVEIEVAIAEDGAENDGEGDGGSDAGGGDPNDPNDPNDGAGGDGDDPNDSGGSDPNERPTTPPPSSVVPDRLAQTGDEVPGLRGATFEYFSNPRVDSSGRVAFWASYRGGPGNVGLFVWEDGVISTLVTDDPNARGVVPGLGDQASFGDMSVAYDGSAPHLTWGGGDRLIFTAHVNGSALPNALLRWRASDNDLITVSDCESLRELIPDVGDTFLCEFFNPGVSDDGIVSYANRYTYFTTGGQFNFRNLGIFTSNGVADAAVIAREFSEPGEVPGRGALATFSSVELLPVIDRNGAVYLQAAYQQAGTDGGNRGLYRFVDGELERLIDNGLNTTWSGLPVNAAVGTSGAPFEAVAANELGQVVVQTDITLAGVARPTLLLWNGQRWRELRVGSVSADALVTGINRFGEVVGLVGGRPYLFGGADPVDLARQLPAGSDPNSISWSAFGGAINNSGRALLRFSRTDGSEGLFFWSGSALLLVADSASATPGAFVELLSAAQPALAGVDRAGAMNTRPELDVAGRAGMLSDADVGAIRMGSPGSDGSPNTADDYQAVFLIRGQ